MNTAHYVRATDTQATLTANRLIRIHRELARIPDQERAIEGSLDGVLRDLADMPTPITTPVARPDPALVAKGEALIAAEQDEQVRRTRAATETAGDFTTKYTGKGGGA